jgi:hypothetical protein
MDHQNCLKSLYTYLKQEIVNIYCTHTNNLYGFPHVQLDTGKEILIAVLTPKGIFEYLLAKGLKVPQLAVVCGALIAAFGNRTKRIKRQALIGFEIDGVSYELVFMIAPNVVPGAILGISFIKVHNVIN